MTGVDARLCSRNSQQSRLERLDRYLCRDVGLLNYLWWLRIPKLSRPQTKPYQSRGRCDNYPQVLHPWRVVLTIGAPRAWRKRWGNNVQNISRAAIPDPAQG